jgi:hypothetical protein
LQLGHLPIQRALVPPHSVQVNIDLSLAMGGVGGEREMSAVVCLIKPARRP